MFQRSPRAQQAIALSLEKPPYPSARLSPVSIAPGGETRLFARISMDVKLDARNVSEPASGARLRDRHRVSRVHIAVPEDGAARFRGDSHPLQSRRALHRAEVAQV